MLPLVSILIPAYNSQKWIASTIRSALRQSYPYTEVIIVDDGSTDNTLSIAKSFQSKRVQVATQQNLGAASARNTAYSFAQGEYIQWLDADDLLAPDKVAIQVSASLNTSSSFDLLSSSWASFLYSPKRAIFRPSPLWADLKPSEFLRLKLESNAFMQTAVWLVSRELSEAAGPWDTRMHVDDDGEYFCRVLLNAHNVKFVPDAKVYYRMVVSDSLSYVGSNPTKIEAMALTMTLHVKYLRLLDDSQSARSACLVYLQRNLTFFYPDYPELVAKVRAQANELGAEIKNPKISPKYSWISAVMGIRAAKRIQKGYNRVKSTAFRIFDLFLSMGQPREL